MAATASVEQFQVFAPRSLNQLALPHAESLAHDERGARGAWRVDVARGVDEQAEVSHRPLADAEGRLAALFGSRRVNFTGKSLGPAAAGLKSREVRGEGALAPGTKH